MLITLPLAAKYKYNVSLCMIFQDDAPYLKEWIEFHRLAGVDHFYLYNNLSHDNYQEILQPYIDQKIVDLIDWPYEAKHWQEWDHIQVTAYRDAFKRARLKTKWLGLLDSDEFLFPASCYNLSTFLKDYERLDGVGGLCAFWVVYGTSWVKKIPEDNLLIEALVLSSISASDHFKSIFMPKYVKEVCTPHHVTFKDGYHSLNLGIEKIRVNHYWPRDEWYLNNVKIPRRLKWGTDEQTCKLWSEASNGARDESIFKYIEPLRKIMGKIN